jgi:hypothetical protein
MDVNINGEYYVSLVYNLLIRDGSDNQVYEVPYMLQWGTPFDLDVYNSDQTLSLKRRRNKRSCN